MEIRRDPKTNVGKGKIRLKETGEGIPDLPVELYTVDIFGVIDLDFNDTQANRKNPSHIRLGSAITDENGEFSISYDDLELPVNNEANQRNWAGRKWVNLLLKVLVPVGDRGDQAFYISEIKERAGRKEVFYVVLSKAQLLDYGLKPPGVLDPGAVKKELEKTINRRKMINEQVRQVLKKEIAHKRTKQQKIQEHYVKPFCNTISKVPAHLRDDKYHFVKYNESVAEKTKNNIVRKLRYVYNTETIGKRPISEGILKLNDEQKEELFTTAYQNEDGDFEIPEEKSAEILKSILKNSKTGESESAELRARSPVAGCFEEASEARKQCLIILGGNPGDEVDDNSSSEDPVSLDFPDEPPATKEDIPLFIGRQMMYASSPENPVVFGVGERAKLDDLKKAVDALKLRSGPADIPAYFDFHNLQIAFDHVWQELMDEGLLDLATAAFEWIEEFGREDENDQPAVHTISLNDIKKEVGIINGGGGFYTWAASNSDLRPDKTDIIADPTDPVEQPPYADVGTGPAYGTDRSGRLTRHDVENDACMDSKDIHSLIRQLGKLLDTDTYSFTTYAANQQERSVNFGILATYRQKWEPHEFPYQAGDLVKSIPLAPKEIKKYSKKITVKKSRTEKEIENRLQVLKSDSSDTGRAESEIMSKVFTKGTYSSNSTTKGSISFPVSQTSNSQTTNFTGEASRESRDLKKSFRENVFKSAQEYRTERKVEINTTDTFENEFTESGEITNPNDELAVTYLFYELYRRYYVTERIHRLRPVVLVAQEMPRPNEIDDAWLVTHDWILRRILLDDSFVPALNYLNTIAGDEFMVIELKKEVEQQRKLVDDLRISLKALQQETDVSFRTLQRLQKGHASTIEDPDVWDGLPVVGDALDSVESAIGGISSLFGGGDDPVEADRLRVEAAQAAFQKVERERNELLSRLSAETGRLSDLSGKYTNKWKDKLTKLTQIARLKIHIKQNILHYMHGIWEHEHPDQRFFRLHHVKVPKLHGSIKLTISSEDMKQRGEAIFTTFNPNTSAHKFKIKPELNYEFTDLSAVADLDNLLGFKGNYMIFPLKKSNVLTDYMMAPYIDAELGLKDPDEFGNWTLDEFARYVCCLKKELPEEELASLIPDLTAQYKKLLTDPLRQGETLVVPTGSLYIEALPGTYPILEDYKLAHRAIDVKKAQAESRHLELENIRLSARLLQGELDDPEVEKKVIIHGNGNINADE